MTGTRVSNSTDTCRLTIGIYSSKYVFRCICHSANILEWQLGSTPECFVVAPTTKESLVVPQPSAATYSWVATHNLDTTAPLLSVVDQHLTMWHIPGLFHSFWQTQAKSILYIHKLEWIKGVPKSWRHLRNLFFNSDTLYCLLLSPDFPTAGSISSLVFVNFIISVVKSYTKNYFKQSLCKYQTGTCDLHKTYNVFPIFSVIFSCYHDSHNVPLPTSTQPFHSETNFVFLLQNIGKIWPLLIKDMPGFKRLNLNVLEKEEVY